MEEKKIFANATSVNLMNRNSGDVRREVVAQENMKDRAILVVPDIKALRISFAAVIKGIQVGRREVVAQENMKDIVRLMATAHSERELFLHCAVFIDICRAAAS